MYIGIGLVSSILYLFLLKRENWKPEPPHVDPDGWFFSADTLPALAAKIKNPHQRRPMSGEVLQATVDRYNALAAKLERAP